MPAWKRIVEEFELLEYLLPDGISARGARWRRNHEFVEQIKGVLRHHRYKLFPKGQRYRITIEKIDREEDSQ